MYAGLAHMGIDSRRADEMEVWEVAAAFGVHRPKPEDEAPPDPYAGFDPIKARMEALKQGKPPPTLPPPKRRSGRQ